MPDYILGILISLPYILAAIATLMSWRFISRRLLFIVTAVLSLMGLQALVNPGAIFVLLPSGEGLTEAAAHVAFTRTVIVSSVIQIILGLPFLWWLYLGFKPNSPLHTDAQARQ